MGDCGAPNTAFCDSLEHNNLKDLKDLFTTEFFANPSSIDLY